MKKTQWLTLLMSVAILGVAGFQAYWLRQNYVREKTALELKTNAAFRETMIQLQAAKLKLDGAHWLSKTEKPMVRIVMTGEKDSLAMVHNPRQEVVSTVNIIRDKVFDSIRKKGEKGMVISMNNTTVKFREADSAHLLHRFHAPPGDSDLLINLLYGVDSLQEPIRVSEIDSAYSLRLKKEKLDIPFSIQVADSSLRLTDKDQNYVVVGFAKPIVYQYQLGNSFPYLLNRIALPVLFSLLLLGITLLSFILLFRNMQKQQRLAALKNEFISNITHELKTPIATVGVAIEALKNFNVMDNPGRTREYLDISGNELQRLSLLVDKVLKLSMFEKKEIELQYETLNMRELVQEVVASMKLQLEKRKADLHIIQEGDVSLQADKLHLLSVIFNLVDNAIKYTGDQPEISIRIKGEEQDVILTVSDNGIGIPAAYHDKVFEKFFRVPHGDTHNAKGYGLGLSYVSAVIRKHGGTITAENNKGGGVSIVIRIPKTIVS